MRITVPATSANVGPGFDSVGVAVSKYLTIEILEPSEKWEVLHDLGDVPSDETNLLITTALQVKADLQPHRIKMVSEKGHPKNRAELFKRFVCSLRKIIFLCNLSSC